MEIWTIVIISVGTFMALATVFIGVVVCLTVRRYERRKALRQRTTSNQMTGSFPRLNRTPTSEAEGFQALSTDTLSDSEIRDINKSMRRLQNSSSPPSTPSSRRAFWIFDRSKLIGKLAFNQWHFRLGDVTIYTARSCSVIVLNRSSQPVRVRIRLVFINGVNGSVYTPSHITCSAVCDPAEKVLQGNDKAEFYLSLIPMIVGDVIRAFLRITAHSLENVSFAPYYLPLHICGQPITPDAVPQLTPQEVEGGENIGSGGAGFVYRKVVPRLGPQPVAIKRFNVVQATEEDLLDFQREVSNICRLNHPSIVRILAVCVIFPTCCLVMEYMPLGSLDRYIRSPHPNSIPSWRYRIRLALDGARALGYLHAVQVLHRDIKDANFLVASMNHEDQVVLKLADFSLSKHPSQTREKLLSDKGKQRASVSGLGAPQWRSLESFRDEKESPESDVWSFGVVMWQLATLRLPFEGQCLVHEIPDRVIEGMRPRDPDLQTPEGYMELVKSCWHEARQKRPTFGNIISALHQIQVQEGWEQPCNADNVQWTTEEDEDDEEDEEEVNGDDLSDDEDDNTV